MDRSQPFLLPPSVQEFIPEDDLAWFLIDAVAAMDTTAFHARSRLGSAGRAGYDPDMLLTLLVYAYCLGQRSSRRIEALCVRDLGFRVVTGNRVVDHSTIAAFRANHEEAIKKLFTEVLLLCAKAGLRQVGVVAVDGTKIAASAGLGKTREREALQREYERLSAEVESMLAQAAATDAHQDSLYGPDNRGDELPAELRRRLDRLARLKETLRQIDQARAEHDADEHGPTPTGRPRRADKIATAQRKLDQLTQRRDQRVAKEQAAGRRLPGSRPDYDALIAQAEADLAAAQGQADTTPTPEPPDTTPTPEPPDTTPTPEPPGTALAVRPGCSVEHLPSAARRGNATDPDSRMLRTQRGWTQGYNCQAASVRVQHGRRLVLAAAVSQDANDVRLAIPMMDTAVVNADRAGLGTIDLFALDAGYWSDDNLTAPGPDRVIAPGKNRVMLTELRANGYATDEPPPDASPADRMRHRLRTQTGAESYAQRAPTIEPVFGDTKHNRGITAFQRRGKPAADNEWKLINATSNLLTLHRHTRDPARGRPPATNTDRSAQRNEPT
ncbi:transposase [Plantactinospora sp. WMMB334]|uniref:transposase n=1 Tax=Plantactinospora sp. WMMB334 TaxID=3404119 RepID=UPI003B962DED